MAIGTDWMTALPVTRTVARWVADRPWDPPPDLGVTVRGALGKAVLDIACVRDDRQCPICDDRDRCVVPTWYDPARVGSHAARPFALRVDATPPAGTLQAVITWFGVVPRPSLVVQALVRAGRAGLGAERIRHRLDRLEVHGEEGPVWVIADRQEAASWPAPASLADLVDASEPDDAVVVDLASRLRLRRDRQPPEAAELISAGIGRVRQLARLAGAKIDRWWPEPGAVQGAWVDRRFEKASRWSQRQGDRIDLSGWQGTLALGAEAHAFTDLLVALEVLQIGHGTSAGMGAIRLRRVREDAAAP